jgi:hypothetical protein
MKHIPPISLITDSIILITTSEAINISKGKKLKDKLNPEDKKLKYKLKLEGKNIQWVRVLLSNGDIVFNGYDNHLAKDSKIKIWVDRGNRPQITIENAGKYLELKSDKEFSSDGVKYRSQIYDISGGRSGISSFKRTYDTDNPISRLQILTKNNRVVFEFNKPPAGDDAFIKWILIWPDVYEYDLH